MKLKLITLTLFTLICAFLFWRESQLTPQKNAHDTPFSELTFTSLSGQKVPLNSLPKASTIHLHFWATWCAPCIQELPALIRYAAKTENTTILAISTDATPEIIPPFLKKLGINPSETNNILWMQDPTQSITNTTFNVYKFPETLILDHNYQLKERLSGAQQWDKL